MCRLAAYIGPSITLGQFLLAPRQGLVLQSYAPREMHEGHVNADGYGVGWLTDSDELVRLTHSIPIWADHNLNTLSRLLHASLWLGSVRNATTGTANHPANNQPFLADGLLFLHNGYIENFAEIRGHIRRHLSAVIEASIEGTTDSEYLFALLRQIRLEKSIDIPTALTYLMRYLAELMHDKRALLNIILTDGKRLYAVRHAHAARPPSLHFTTDEAHYPGGRFIASEPLTDDTHWQVVPEHHLLILDAQNPVNLVALRL